MNYKAKNLLQSLFSYIPRGEYANYLFQRYVTKRLPPSNVKFLKKVNDGVQHYRNFKSHNKLTSPSGKYYEFGAGWTLTIPLTMSFLGFDVYCIDIRRLIIKDLIIGSLKKFDANKKNLPPELDRIEIGEIDHNDLLGSLQSKYGLKYFAPLDARATGFPDETFDFMSSTVTMEHIPKDDILKILIECYRILKSGGILSMTIDYQDHWSYFDKSISIYNFLKYSSSEWSKYNPPLHFQNRLRHSDYKTLISRSGFTVVSEAPRMPTQENLAALTALKINKEFANYEIEDLAIRGVEIVLTK